jgi:hypothetical protein
MFYQVMDALLVTCFDSSRQDAWQAPQLLLDAIGFGQLHRHFGTAYQEASMTNRTP